MATELISVVELPEDVPVATESNSVAALRLPDDGLAKVLGVLPPQSLAVARCVCTAWRDVIDARALLLPHLLPHSVRGVLINYIDHYRPHLLARPASSSTFPNIDGLLSFLPNKPERDWWTVLDHCNGLVLCNIKWESELLVCNPATQRWTVLPGKQSTLRHFAYLAFDPFVSSQYEVFLIPVVPGKPKMAAPVFDAPFCLEWLFSLTEGASSVDEDDQTVKGQGALSIDGADQMDKGQCHDDDDPCHLVEWPPSQWILKVFSSTAGLWEDRPFVQKGQPAGTFEDMRLDPLEQPLWGRAGHAVYQNGELYVHCQGSFVARFSLSTDKYQVFKIPTTETKIEQLYLGGCKNEVFFGMVTGEGRQLRLWMLRELCGHMEWLLKYEADIGLYADHVALLHCNDSERCYGSWMVEEATVSVRDRDSDAEMQSEESIEWDSDKDDIFTVGDGEEACCSGSFHILGFHPYKDVVFLARSFDVVSYHFTSPIKTQYLGNSYPRCYEQSHANGMDESFIYTPCMIGDLLHGGGE